jgi:HPt (histidine-containing phosphotransfer) domain-containing protein
MNIEFLRENDIDVDSGIEILGDIEMYDETLDDFVLEMEERIPNIEKYKEESDMENYAILVHALKGDYKYLGFTKLADLAYNHQIKSQEGNVDYVNEHYDELMNEVNRVMSVINEYKNM